MMKKVLSYSLQCSMLIILMLVIRPASANVSLLVLGDSLSAGYGISQADTWVAEIERRWQREYPEFSIINASISGDTTRGGLNRIEDVVNRHQPDVVFIELGGNDGLRGFQLDTIRDNLTQLIDYLHAEGVYVALSQIDIPPNMGRRYTTEFSALFADVADQYDIVLVPFFMLDIATDPELMQSDGIHPNLAAQTLIADIMEPQLRALLEEVSQ
ncbi:MAG: arylesterase [Idiomarina sp.]|nr:arylesterase [Idiomarina sp.]